MPRLDRNLKLSPSSDHPKEHSIQQRHSKQVTTVLQDGMMMMIDSNHLAVAVSAMPRLDRNLKLSPSSDHPKEHSMQQQHSKQITTDPMFMNQYVCRL
jgi:hypothetical protein